ncbi:VOC family protein [Streptosporangium sp. NPDC000396]|uniref:VOC family protein n=1 Tax=Streptosporangium sp. NPDC000396 TaxID=3366185 RepID=UPI00368FAF5B
MTRLSACLAVRDLDRCAAWYADTLGFTVARRHEFPELGASVAYLALGEQRLELLQPAGGVGLTLPAPPGHALVYGVTQLACYVDDIEAARDRVLAAGIPLAMDPVTVPELGVSAFFIRDPEGNLIEFIQEGVTGMATTREVAERWFTALTSSDIDTALSCLAEDVEWINYTPVPGFNDDMPWIGTYRGPQAVLESFKVFTGLVDVKSEELTRLLVDGDEATGIIRERSVVRPTGMEFDIEFVQRLWISDGKIVRWKSYTDPSQIIRALRGTA